MIKKFASIHAPVQIVSKVFTDLESWQEWMPGLRQLKILERQGDTILTEMTQVQMGRKLTQKMELQISPRGMKQRQITGWFRKWEGEWRFLESPDKVGTTVSVAMDIEAGRLIPKFLVFDTFSEIFGKLMKAAEARSKELFKKDPTLAPRKITELAEEKLLQIYQTPAGLEIWIGEKRYFLRSAN